VSRPAPELRVADLIEVVNAIDLELRPKFTGSRRGKGLLLVSAIACLLAAAALFWLSTFGQQPGPAFAQAFAIVLAAIGLAIGFLLLGDRAYLFVRRVLPWVLTTLSTAMSVLAGVLAGLGVFFAWIVGFTHMDAESFGRALGSAIAALVGSLLLARTALELTPAVLSAEQVSPLVESSIRLRTFAYWLCMSALVLDFAFIGSSTNLWDLGLLRDAALGVGVLVFLAWSDHRSRVRESLYRIAEIAGDTSALLVADSTPDASVEPRLAVRHLITALHAAGNPRILGITVRATIAPGLLACLEYVAETELGIRSPAHLHRVPQLDAALARHLHPLDARRSIAKLAGDLADRSLIAVGRYR